ncbi:hypothetical protein QTV39_004599 [Vibrio parahaemolyticus]|nr:hypothetical protein [Vibrio parahaemolyticus]
MESVLKFLEEKESSWSMDYGRYSDFIQVADKFGYEFITYKTDDEVRNYLKEKIKETLRGEDINHSEFNRIQDHLALKFYSSDEMECVNSLKFVRLIRFVINSLPSYTNSADAWCLVRDYLEAFLSISQCRPDDSWFSVDENRDIAKSIQFLRNKGYQVSVLSGYPRLSEKDEERLFQAIDYRLNKMGSNAICFTLQCVSELYDASLKRFFLRSEPSVTNISKLDIPWGYIFNVSLDNLHFVKKTRNHRKQYIECVDLLKHYFCIQKLQTFNKISDLNHRHDTILPAMQKEILYDQYYSIDQISDKHIVKIVSGIFTSIVLEPHTINVDLHIDILKFVSKYSKHDRPLVFNDEHVYRDLLYKYSFKDIRSTLQLLSFESGEINSGYLKPEDIAKRNYFEKPFVYVDDKYIYINHTFNNYGFYTSLLNLFRNEGVDGNIMGKAVEDFVESLFVKSGIEVHSNKEYKVSKLVAKELSIQSQKRECDFIIETSDTIIFIELKRKTLTTEARAGNSLKSVVDLSQSFFHALAQTGCHEYLLRRDGVINFEDGTKIELLGRNVERVALSLFGFFGVQDGAFIHQVLNSLIDTQIESGDKKEDKKVNKILLELQNQYRSNVFNEAYCQHRMAFLNCRFFSVPQFMEMLSNSSNNEEFEVELNHTRQGFTGCKDWFKDYQFIRKLKKA